jgi:hypothetical protein
MKKILIWRYYNNDSLLSGAIIVDNSEYNFWLELLNKQTEPFVININSHEEDTVCFENGQELIDNVKVITLDYISKMVFKNTIGDGIGILNFYTDVISDLDNSDFFIDMSDSDEEEIEEEEI